MKFPKRERAAGGAETEDVVRRSGWRLERAGQIGRQEAAVSRAGVEALLGRRLSEQHLGAIERANCGADESASARKHVERDIIRVRPNTHLRIVREIRIGEGITIPRAGDRKSTRLNSSHLVISYAVFC